MVVKVAIIGSGFGLYGLLPAFNSTSGCEVVSICGRKTKRLTDYCQSIGLKKIYLDWKKMLNSENLDAVAMAVVPAVQPQIVKYAIAKGLHVFTEKPLAVTLKKAEEMLALAKKRKVVHMIDFEFPEIDEWVKVKQLLDKKAYGRLRQIGVNWDFVSHDIKNKVSSWKTDASKGGGALAYYFSHSLHYLEHFAGEISTFSKELSYSEESLNGGEVGIDLLLKFKNGVAGYAHMSCNSKGMNRHEITFICEKATIVLANEGSYTSNFQVKIYEDEGLKILPAKRVTSKSDEDERVKVVKKLTGRFISAILHQQNPRPSFVEGVRVQELIEQIRNSNNV